jgi:hypothetical protein
MNHLARISISQAKDGDISFLIRDNWERIPLDQLKKSAQDGTLRMSLLQKLNLESKRKERASQYKSGITGRKAEDVIYDLLMKSHEVELKRVLNEYANLCNNASFIKGLAGQQSNFKYEYRSQGNGDSRSNKNNNNSSYYDAGVSADNLFAMLKKYVSLSDNPKVREVTIAWKKTLKKIHPDLTSDPDERTKRTKETQILNRLYRDYIDSNPKASAQRSARE